MSASIPEKNTNASHHEEAADLADEKEKLTTADMAQPDDKEALGMDDTSTTFINGGNSLADIKVEIRGDSRTDTASFTGLGKEELKRYEQDPMWIRVRYILFIIFWVIWLSMLVSAIIIIVLAPRCPTKPDLKWYHKDAFYNIYAKSFFDGRDKQDGYGDLEGVEKKEEYVNGLSADTTWLSSLLRVEGDNDRAILDHKALDPRVATLDVLRAFCKKMAKEGKRVIMDLVPNQTSKNHTWFTRSQRREGKYSDYYVWADPINNREPTRWEREDRSGRMWVWDTSRSQYYLSQFKDTADLNLTNPDVMEEFRDILQFWVSQGISGFHINDIEYLTERTDFTAQDFSETQTKNHEDNAGVVESLRKMVDHMDNKLGREKLLMGTVTAGATPDTMALYLGGGEGGQTGVHLLGVMLDQMTRHVTATDLQSGLEPYVNQTSSHWLGWRLSSSRPGSHRAYNRVGSDRMTIAHTLQMLLPGTALMYYGDEISMESGLQYQYRTVSPMQWTKGANSGFSNVMPWLPLTNSYKNKNVDSMTAQLHSGMLMEAFTSLAKLRTKESMQHGHTLFCSEGSNLLTFARHAPGFKSFMIAANMGSPTAHVFGDSDCARGKEKAQLVFHSHKETLEDSEIRLDKAVHFNENEVLIFELPA